MMFSLVLGGSLAHVLDDIIGIVIGHLYYFMEDIFPHQQHGFKIIQTPDFLKRIFNENYQEELEARQRRENPTPAEPIPEELPENNNPGGYDFGGD